MTKIDEAMAVLKRERLREIAREISRGNSFGEGWELGFTSPKPSKVDYDLLLDRVAYKVSVSGSTQGEVVIGGFKIQGNLEIEED